MKTLNQIVKSMLHRVAPKSADRWAAARQRRHIERFEERTGLNRVVDRFVAMHGLKVQGGPFSGLTYVSHSSGSAILPKLVGSYEAELALSIETITQTPYRTIVDVGSAEGYYAVGLAVRIPSATVYAYDIDEVARSRCAELARVNRVSDRVLIRGRCDAGELAKNLTDLPALLMCDCEGFELDLLDPLKTPALRSTHMLVELHDHLRPGLTETLRSRFAATHRATMFGIQPRQLERYASIQQLDRQGQELAVNEFRPAGQQWVEFQPI